MSSLLTQLLNKNKSAVGAVVKKESSDEPKAAASAPESGSGKAKPVSSPMESNAAKASPAISTVFGKTQPKPVSTVSDSKSADEGTHSSPNAVVAGAKPNLLTSLAATRQQAEKAQADHDYLFAEIPKDFQEVLNRFDELMNRDQNGIDFHLTHIRNYVQRIMVDLRENPEYDGLIIDRDVHNIMAFLQRTKSQAELTIANKQTKSATRAAKPKGKDKFAMDFSSIDLGAGPPKSLADLSETNTDTDSPFGDLSGL